MSSPEASCDPPTPGWSKSLQPGADQLPVEVEERVGVVALVCDVALERIHRRQPRRAGREPAACCGIPLHRVTRAVAARAVERRGSPGGVPPPPPRAPVDETPAPQ